MGGLFGGGTKTTKTDETQNQSGSYQNTQNPLIPGNWNGNYNDILKLLSQNAQQNNPLATQIQDINSRYTNELAARPAITLAGAAQKYGGAYAAPTPVSAQTAAGGTVGAVGDVNGQRALQYMGGYQNPYTDQVVNASLADLQHTSDVNQNDLRARYGGAGTGGGSGEQVAAGVMGADTARAAGSLGANLRSSGFNTALGAGQADAASQLAALQGNQNVGLQRMVQQATLDQQNSQFNSSNNLNAQQFNNNMTNNRQQFDVNAAYQGQANQSQNSQNMIQNYLAQQGLNNQQMDEALKALGIGTSTFGQQNQGSSDSTTHTTGTQKTSGGGNFLGTLGMIAGGLGGLGWKPFK